METKELKQIDIDNFSRFINVFRVLQKISRQLHRSFENECNYGLTLRQEKRQENLIRKAEKLAKELGFELYVQSDPRGCALYLMAKESMNKGSSLNYYSDGIAVY